MQHERYLKNISVCMSVFWLFMAFFQTLLLAFYLYVSVSGFVGV